MTGKQLAIYLVVFLVLSGVTFLFCYGWVETILYVDKIANDSTHEALGVGLSFGFIIPLGAAAGLGGIAYGIANKL